MILKRLGVLFVAAITLAGCEYKSTPDPVLSARDAEYLSMVPTAKTGLNF